MERPTISIVTPSFNQERYIERTIKSVIDQDCPGLEYMILDGGSADGTLAILRKYEGALRWVSEKDAGQSQAVNKGIQATSGEVIGWLNSDDTYYPGAVKAVVDFFALHPESEVLYGDACHIDERDNAIERYNTEPWSVERLKQVCFLCQPAVFFRRSIVDRFGLLDETLRYCMDYEYWIRLARGGATFAYLPKVLAGSRCHPETKTVRSRVQVHTEINGMLLQKFGRVPDKWLINYAHAVVEGYEFRRADGFRFVGLVWVVFFYASLRWNRKISPGILGSVFRSSVGAIRRPQQWEMRTGDDRLSRGEAAGPLSRAKRDGS